MKKLAPHIPFTLIKRNLFLVLFIFLGKGLLFAGTGIMANQNELLYAPSYSTAAFQLACNFGFESIYVPVQQTKDKFIVISSSPVDDSTLEQVKQWDIGISFALRFREQKVSTLNELLEFARDQVHVTLELPDKIDAALVVADIHKSSATSYTFVSGPVQILKKIHEQDPNIQLMATPLDDITAKAIRIPITQVTRKKVKHIHSNQQLVVAEELTRSTPNHLREKALREGVDLILTMEGENIVALQHPQQHRPLKVIGHRGANRFAPENTVPGFEKAIDMKVDYVEMDIRTTKDGFLVLYHDDDLSTKTSGHGPVSSVTLKELEQLEIGSWFGKPFAGTKIPLFKDVLKKIRGRTHVYCDVSSADLKQVADELTSEQMFENAVIYCSKERLIEFKEKYHSNAKLMPSLKSTQEWPQLRDLGFTYLDGKWAILSPEFLREIHESRAVVFSDAIGSNENIEAYRKAINAGLDGIQTDTPPLVYKAFSR